MELAVLVFWIVFSAIAVESLTEVLVKSRIFDRPRKLIASIPKVGNFFKDMLSCGHCTSGWLAPVPAIVACTNTNVISNFIGFLPLTFIMWWLVIWRVSNYAHDTKDKMLDKYYSKNHYSSNSKGLKE